MSHKILSKEEARQIFKVSRATWDRRVKSGLVPKPIKLGRRQVGWLQSELDQVMSALIAGSNESQLVELVNLLHSKRKEQGNEQGVYQ